MSPSLTDMDIHIATMRRTLVWMEKRGYMTPNGRRGVITILAEERAKFKKWKEIKK
jgi:hypothetical protein